MLMNRNSYWKITNGVEDKLEIFSLIAAFTSDRYIFNFRFWPLSA